MSREEIIIVGAGPAGSYAGYRLANKGYSVRILDKAIFPRYKPCGGGILTKTNKIMPIKEEWIEARFDSVSLTYKYQKPVQVSTDKDFVMMVDREKFDYEMVKLAEKAGANLCQGITVKSVEENSSGVKVITDQGSFEGNYLIAADGARSQVGRSLNLDGYQQRLGVALEGEFLVAEEDFQRYSKDVHLNYGDLPNGYSWIFPKDGYLSIGTGTFKSRYPGLKANLDKYLESLNIDIKETLKLQGSFIPLGGINQVFSGRRTLFVGDAAGLVDPLTGEGIYYALKSSELAVETVIDLKSGFQIGDYDKKIKAEILPEILWALKSARWGFKCSWLVHKILMFHPELLKYLLDILAGEASYSPYFGMLFRKVPGTLLKSTILFKR